MNIRDLFNSFIKKETLGDSYAEEINRINNKIDILSEKVDKQSSISLDRLDNNVDKICDSIKTLKVTKKKSGQELFFCIIPIVISIFSLVVSFGGAVYNIRLNGLLHHAEITCEYTADDNTLHIQRDANGTDVIGQIEVSYIPFISASFIFVENDQFCITEFPKEICFEDDWKSDNINVKSKNILTRNLNDWDKEFLPTLEKLKNGFDGSMGSTLQLGYLIRISYNDEINNNQITDYYEILTRNKLVTECNRASVITNETYDTYELRKIDNIEANKIFNTKCVYSLIDHPEEWVEKLKEIFLNNENEQ